MATTEQRIVEYLKSHPEGADDDQLATALNLSARQNANIQCRAMASKGIIHRVKPDGGKIRNFWGAVVPVERITPKPEMSPVHAETDPHDHWYWEGRVQSVVVGHLVKTGCCITRVCDTKSREPGKDIEAARDSRPVWVTVKGYPNKTPKTQPQTQARHWFSGAVFDIVCWRDERADAELFLALPDFPTYRNLAKRMSWLQSAVPFSFIWVKEDGEIEVN